MQFTDFSLSDSEFDRLRGLVRQITAIELSDNKRQLVYSRFSRRLRALGLQSFSQYCDLVESGEGNEADALASAITTNFTRFFRERHHFDHLRDIVERFRDRRHLRIWSAGCATGEEAYSIAITLLESLPDIDDWDIRILATDLDASALKIAAEGVYPLDRAGDVENDVMSRWFLRGRGQFDSYVRVASRARELIRFRELNLIAEWPMRRKFDVIFCRNVMIYFGVEAKRTLVRRFAEYQQSGDTLIVGHSENLTAINDVYTPVGDTIYRHSGSA